MKNKTDYYLLAFVATLLVTSCVGGSTEGTVPNPEQAQQRHSLLQGVWVDDEAESVQFRIEGDTIFYPESTLAPLHFSVRGDSLVVDGAYEATAYKILLLSETHFSYQSLTNETVKLHKSDRELDAFLFETALSSDYVATVQEVVKRDSVVMYGGHRYRGYVTVNPSQMKVYKNVCSDVGMCVEEIYYDNVINICVYELTTCLYSRDFYKFDFAEVIPEHYLREAILANMWFMGVSSDGYLYRASVGIPEEVGNYLVDVTISPDGEYALQLAKN